MIYPSGSPSAATSERSSSRLLWAWLLTLLPLAAIWPALTNNVAALAYDAATAHLNRSVVYSQAVSDGVLVPRWSQFLHWGLGSPLFTFHPPLAYALMDLLSRLGIPQPVGWRLMIAGGLLLAFVGAYGLIRALTGRRWPAVFAATAYLYAPYVLRNTFERGSAETFSMFLYPAVLWSLLAVARKRTPGRFALALVLWVACICFHVLGPLMLTPFAVLFAAALAWRRRTAAALLVLAAGVLLTAPIWAPAFAELNWVQADQGTGHGPANPVANPIPLDELLSLPVVYDVQRDNNRIGEQIGLLQGSLLIAGLLGAAYAWFRRNKGLALALGAATLCGLALFWMLTASSDPVWRLLAPILQRMEFRSRLMGLEALFAAIAGGLALNLLPDRWQHRAALAGGLLAIAAAAPLLYPGLHHHYADFGLTLSLTQVRQAEIRSGGTAFTSFNEFMPRSRTDPFDSKLAQELGAGFNAESRPLADPHAGVELLASRVRTESWDLDVRASQPTTLTLYLLFYPRWLAWVDGQPAPLAPQPGTGYVQVRMPGGEHHLGLRYGTTAVESAALALAGLTVMALIIAWGGRSLRPDRSRRPVRPSHLGDAETRKRGDGGEPAPHIGLLAILTGVLVFKFAYVDGATTWLRCVSTAERVCGAETTTDVLFPAAPSLAGYTISGSQARPGAQLRVDLFWKGQPGTEAALASFVHVRNGRAGGLNNPRTGNEIWAQDEHNTPGGLLATEYLPEKLYKDVFRVSLPEDMPPGEYFLEVGWYNPQSAEQLDPRPETVRPPLKILWRSILLPSIAIR